MLIGIVLLLALSVTVQAQTYTGTYQMVGIKVGYHNIARTVESAGDSVANYFVEAKWPNAATPVYSHTLAGYAPGDTMFIVETPDFLLTPAGLAYVGIDLSVALNMEDGQMLIPAVDGTSNTFPTTTTENCSSYAVISPVNDNANISSTYTSNSYNSSEGDNGTFTWGFGIAQSVVFDWFDAPNDWENPSGLENFGRLKGFFNASGSGFDVLEVNWHAVDGPDSDSGIDDAGDRDRFLGISVVPGDTVTVAALNAALGTSFNVGTYPILGGEGVDLDNDGEPDGVVNTDWGYLFDPKGADGVMMNGDEPLQFTGYYFTSNFLTAAGALSQAYTAGMTPTVDTDNDGVPDTPALVYYFVTQGLDATSALIMAADSLADLAAQTIATAFGLDAGTAAAIGASVGAYAGTTLTALLTSGVPLEEAMAQTGAATAVYALGALAQAGVALNDSDHDYDGTNGRLVFQIGNSCIPNTQTRDVFAIFDNFTVGIGSEDILPTEFAVYENYPNPFNPTTEISFDLTEFSPAEVTVWNILGQKVATLYSGKLPAGRHTISFDARAENGNMLPSGIYIYRVEAGNKVATKKMMLLK